MMVIGAFSQLMAPGLHATFTHWLDTIQRSEEYSHIFKIETSDKAFEDEVEFSGLPPLVAKPEGESVVYQDAIQGGGKRYIHTTYALGVRSSWELYEDDLYGLILQIPKALARSAQFVKEIQTWNILNLGFSSVTTSDGVTLFNNQHPLLGGTQATNTGPGLANIIGAAGTYPNRPATDVDLSFTAVQLAINQFERLVDSQGLPITMQPKWLIIPPELKWIAAEILGSPHKPYTSDNEINVLMGEDLRYFVCHYLTSQSAWFLVCDDHSMKHIVRKPLSDDFSDDFDTFSIKQITRMRFSTGATSWMGTWGSNGP